MKSVHRAMVRLEPKHAEPATGSRARASTVRYVDQERVLVIAREEANVPELVHRLNQLRVGESEGQDEAISSAGKKEGEE